MKKKSALLALLLAGLMSVSVIGTAGCKKHVPDNSDQNQTDTSDKDKDKDKDENKKPDGDDGEKKPEDDKKPDGDDEKKPDDGEEKNPGGDDEEKKPDPKPEPEPVVVNSDTAISLVAGQTRTLTASEGVTWTTTDAAVATVNSSGLVTAKTAGVTKVKATKAGEIITCTVIVLKKEADDTQTDTRAPFSFNESVDIDSVTTAPDTPVVSDPNAEEFAVTFSDGAVAQNVANGGMVVEPLVENNGHYLKGWHVGSAAEYYDFNTPVTAAMKLNADWGALSGNISSVQGNFESIAVEWGGNLTDTVSYRAAGSNGEWTEIDSQLIRGKNGDVRADILGLAAGTYDIKVNSTEINGIPVKAYDRSGYAHFNYNDGIGAYNNDGTLKDNAIVIYVTDANKDTVMRDLEDATVQAQMFSIPYYAGITGATKNWNKNAEGIGWWLNNVQYTKKDKKGNVASNTYSTSGSSLGFGNDAFTNKSICIRFIGTVTTPEGCTAYDSLGEGGSDGDNGHMARMKNLKNVTIEGVGDDAEIKGWGFHFMAGSDAKNGRGKGFEVRNITFNEYPEDAVGMEGVQDGSKITGSVERCWIHNNTFLPGYCASPAESDKKEGDGSCDFKRGMYFTCSYNYFEYCHKTNLVGSSDSSLQYNLSYHHNIWYQCGSRIPLTRQANVHFYNNYVFGDPSQKSTPYSHIAKPALSYVHSLRANCYLFSENNYYEGCKNVTDGKNGGAVKFYGNTFYACSDGDAVSNVDTRTQTVNSNCAYDGTSYSNFDTNSSLFYYQNGKSNCLLDDSVSARIRTIFYAGALGHSEVTESLQQMNVNKNPGMTAITSSTKGKGQVATFKLDADALVTVNATGLDPQIIRNDGKMIAEAFTGEKTLQLPAGIYMVCSGIKDKEVTISSLQFTVDTEAAKEARIAAAKKAIGDLPNAVTYSSANIIKEAEAVYNNLLSQEERDEVGAELTQRLVKAKEAYQNILVKYAIARIDYIGTVTKTSQAYIDAAAKAYSAVSASKQSDVTNYKTLTDAQATFSAFEIENVKFSLERIPTTADDLAKIVDSKPAIELALQLLKDAQDEYSELDDEDKVGVNVKPVSDAIATLNAELAKIEAAEKEAQNLVDFLEQLAATTVENVTLATGAKLKAAYEILTSDQKAGVSADDKTKYDAVMEKYNEWAAQAVECSFDKKNSSNKTDGTPTNDMFTRTGGSNKADTVTVGDKTFTNGLKMGKNGGATVSFTVSGRRTLTLYFNSGSKNQQVIVDGETYTIGADGVVAIIIEDLAAPHTITSGNKEINLFYLTLMPVA